MEFISWQFYCLLIFQCSRFALVAVVVAHVAVAALVVVAVASCRLLHAVNDSACCPVDMIITFMYFNNCT